MTFEGAVVGFELGQLDGFPNKISVYMKELKCSCPSLIGNYFLLIKTLVHTCTYTPNYFSTRKQFLFFPSPFPHMRSFQNAFLAVIDVTC